MATTTSLSFYRGYLSMMPTTCYTVPAGTTSIVTNMVVTNVSSVASTFTINFDGYPVVYNVSIEPYTSAFFDLKQVLGSGKTIDAYATGMSLVLQISGVEIA
jgi:hypothetical protein